jgi:ABC-2 type transport system ATP-binding protein/lipopolysaccharide transport system ATP-binding protein
MRSIEVEHLSKRYRLGQRYYVTLRETLASAVRRRGSEERAKDELWALRDVSFSVDEGEVVGVIGRNGVGKSTLLRILARITEPTHGVARTRGKVGALLEVGTGFHPELTGRENIFLNGAILGMTRADIRRRFDEIVSFAGIEKFLETPVKRYSSGMYLRLAFSVAAHFEPDIVVVDEVLAVGDAEFQRRCLGKMSDFAREGRTVLFVSHDLGAVARICPRAVWLEDGVVSHDGPAGRSIELYLDARGQRASHVEFPHDSEDIVQLVSVGIADESGGALDAPRRDDAFAIRVRFLVRERIPGLDVKVYLVTRRGVRVLEENLTDQEPSTQCGDIPGTYEASVVIPPVLAAGDYVLGVAMQSPYQRFFDREVLTFRLWPEPDQRRDSVDRSRLVQPGVEWRLKRPALNRGSEL